VSTGTESVVFNALPLLILAGVYLAVSAGVVPALWRERAESHPLDYAVATVFPTIAVSAAIAGGLVLYDRRPIGGHVWASFVAIALLFIPAILFLARWRDRSILVGRIRRIREAEQRVSLRDRELEAVAALSSALARAGDPEGVSRPLVAHVRDLLGVEFAAVALVDRDRTTAKGVFGELDGQDVEWWPDLRLDLRGEPSGIATAVLDAGVVAVYDVQSSPLVSPRLAELVGAKSGVWVPMIGDGRVIGVLVAVTTGDKRAFGPDEIAVLQALGGEAALALDRMSSAAALSDALEREQLVAEITRKVRAELDENEVVRVAREEVARALEADGVTVDARAVEDAAAGSAPELTLHVQRNEPLDDGERFLVDTVARELALSLQTARLLTENRSRFEQQRALVHAAQVVTSELELDVVLQRLVVEVTELLRADAADCYLLDSSRNVLRCAAVHGLDPELIGFAFTPDKGVAGLALRHGRPLVADQYDQIENPVPNKAYQGFSRALVAPMVWGGESRGVLGVAMRDSDRKFDDADIELLEAFARLASLALRNAESFERQIRQARVQQAFYRIAALLGEPLSLAETFDAAAQAAVEALGGDFGAVVRLAAGPLAVVGAYDLPEDVRTLELPVALAEAAADGRIVASSRVGVDDRFGADWHRAPVASVLAVPVEGDSPALVLVFFANPRAFTDDDLELGRQLARAARGACERSRLYEAERTARSLSQQLARTGSLLATELDPVLVLEEVVAQAMALLGTAAGALAQLEGDELVVAAAVGDGAEDAIGARAPSTGWLGGDVVQSRAPVAYADVASDPALAEADAVLAAGYRAYLGVPLVGREDALQGVLTVYDREPRTWREEEIDALFALATNASVALANAELYQRVALEREQSVAILANVADGIVAVDRDGHVVVWNSAAERITGVPANEALGRTPYQVLQRHLESDGGRLTNRLVSIMRGSEEVWLSLSEAVMRDPAGIVAGRIFAFRDISGERAVEQMKSDFVSTVSHELRTPLTSIYGFAETLLRQDIDFGEAERRTFLRYIASESERLTRIVDALLNVARLDTGDLHVTLAPTDVGAVVTDAVATIQATSTNGHQFEIEIDAGGLEAQADPDKLRQVLDQLVQNAVKFSPEGGLVRVEARRRSDAVAVTVADEGAGIPASQRDLIFTKFYRGGDGGPATGTGLGLFIAQGLVSAMGGRIWVDSEEGRGSRFTFELPAARGE
jgi:PAS domain S-box-containing protein